MTVNDELENITWLEAFAATKCKKTFSGDKPCQNGAVVQRLRGIFCVHHQGMIHSLKR